MHLNLTAQHPVLPKEQTEELWGLSQRSAVWLRELTSASYQGTPADQVSSFFKYVQDRLAQQRKTTRIDHLAKCKAKGQSPKLKVFGLKIRITPAGESLIPIIACRTVKTCNTILNISCDNKQQWIPLDGCSSGSCINGPHRLEMR